MTNRISTCACSIVTLIVALLLGPVTAWAQVATDTPMPTATATEATASAPAAAADAKAEPEMICRNVRSTGSRVRKERVCTTRSTSKDAKDWLKRQQERGATDNAGVNGGG